MYPFILERDRKIPEDTVVDLDSDRVLFQTPKGWLAVANKRINSSHNGLYVKAGTYTRSFGLHLVKDEVIAAVNIQ